MKNYLIIIDFWEADTNLDVPRLKAEGVAGLIPRLNDMSGGHHMDANFTKNWDKANLFDVQMIYFVYNPWVDGRANYLWRKQHLPGDYGRRRGMHDIEVKYPNYSPITYGQEVRKYNSYIHDDSERHSIYTGGWFLPLVSGWPGGSYWWGRYPLYFYPKDRTEITWDQLRAMIAYFDYSPDPSKQCPGNVELWQFTADRLILPGFGGRACDMNVFIGTTEQLKAWSGCEGTPLPPPEITDAEKLRRLWAAHPELW